MPLTLGLAFLAGLASFLSPCIFPLIPAYIGYLSGRSLAGTSESKDTNRKDSFLHGLAFIFGFSIVFITIGLFVSSLGSFFRDAREFLGRVGGVVVIIFGLHLSGIIQIPFLNQDLKPAKPERRNRSFVSSMIMGIFFSVGWTPCVGPVLGAIYTMTWLEGNLSTGFFMLLFYSLGLSIPFLIAALGLSWVTDWLKKFSKAILVIQIIMGLILVITGLLLFFGVFEQLARIGQIIDFGM